MIRINLLKNLNQLLSVKDSRNTEGVVYGEVKKTRFFGVLIRVLFILVGPYALYSYETDNISGIQQNIDKERGELRRLNKEIQELGENVQLVVQYKEKKKSLEEQLGVIAKLSRSRLDEVFALDNLQTLIPDRLWLKSLSINEGKMKMLGLATSEDDIASLIQNLDESVFFKKVIFTSTIERKTQEGTLQQFEIQCTVERI